MESRKPSFEKGVELMQVTEVESDSDANSTTLPVVSPGFLDISLPIGHTYYSWRGVLDSTIPNGHTPFSWRYDYSNDS